MKRKVIRILNTYCRKYKSKSNKNIHYFPMTLVLKSRRYDISHLRKYKYICLIKVFIITENFSVNLINNFQKNPFPDVLQKITYFTIYSFF